MDDKSKAGQTKKLFFALWPDDDIRNRLTKVQENANLGQHGNPTLAEKFHITLLFLGDIKSDRVSELESFTRGIRFNPFTIELNQIGFFRQSDIAWCGTSQFSDELNSLVQTIRTGSPVLPKKAVQKNFVPHVTLARKVRRKITQEIDSIYWTVESCCLVCSVPVDGGVEYKIIASSAD